jgi:hypothetical protein
MLVVKYEHTESDIWSSQIPLLVLIG